MHKPRLQASVLATALLAVMSGTACAVQLDYTIDAGVQRDDNVTLSTSNPIKQNFLRTGLGFRLQQNSSMFQASFDGRVEYRGYRDDVFSDTVDGTLTGRLNWVAIPHRLHFAAEDSLTLQPVDALIPNAPGNRQQVNVLSLGPTVFFKWAQTLDGQADLRFINSNAEITDQFNSQRYELSVRAIKQLDPTSRLSFNTQWQDVDFDDVAARDYRRMNAYARYARTMASFDVGVDAGYSWIYYRQDTRKDPLLRVNLSWHPSARSALTLSVVSQFSDTATDALASISPSTAIPEYVPVGDTVINASAFRTRRTSLEYVYTGTRLNFRVAPYVESRTYIDSDHYNEDVEGGQFDASWQLRRNLALGLYGTHETHDYLVLGRKDRTRRLSAYLQQDWSRHWSSRLEWARYQRTSSFAGQDAVQNTLYLSVIYRNR